MTSVYNIFDIFGIQVCPGERHRFLAMCFSTIFAEGYLNFGIRQLRLDFRRRNKEIVETLGTLVRSIPVAKPVRKSVKTKLELKA